MGNLLQEKCPNCNSKPIIYSCSSGYFEDNVYIIPNEKTQSYLCSRCNTEWGIDYTTNNGKIIKIKRWIDNREIDRVT